MIGKVTYNDANLPLITVRTFNEYGEVIKEARIPKSSNGIIKTEEDIKREEELRKKKKEEERLKKEAEEKEKYRNQFKEKLSVLKLPDKFFEAKEGYSKLKETQYRNLQLQPKTVEDNKFIVYNYDGTLYPYKDTDYVNREIYGHIFGLDFFKAFKYEINTDTNMKTVSLKVEVNDSEIESLIQKAMNEIIDLNVYPDLDITETTQYTSPVKKIILDSKPTEELIDQNIVWNTYRDDSNQTDQQFVKDYRSIYEQVKKDIIKSRDFVPREDVITRIQKEIYDTNLRHQFRELQATACEEIQKFKPGECKDKTQVTTLDIKSDYIEKAYIDAYKDAVVAFPRLLQIAYYDVYYDK